MSQLVWPNGSVTEPPRSDHYGPRRSIQTPAGLTRPFHAGTDHHSIGALRSIGAGTIIENSWIGWAGNQVLIYLGEIGGVRTWVRYCHLSAPSPLQRGTRVVRGQVVGYEGETGQVTGKHLHWEIYRGRVDRGSWGDAGSTVDPRAFVRAHLLKSRPALRGEEGEDMTPRQIHYAEGKTLVRAMLVPGTAYFVPWTEGGATYANGFAKNMETGSSTAVTKSLFGALQRAAEALLPRDRVAVDLVDAGE